MSYDFGWLERRLLRCEKSMVKPESLRQRQSRFARMITLFLVWLDGEGYEVTFGDAYARDGHMKGSLHYSRLAFDLNIFRGGKYLTGADELESVGEFWESIGGAWGGRFGDVCHFSLSTWGRK